MKNCIFLIFTICFSLNADSKISKNKFYENVWKSYVSGANGYGSSKQDAMDESHTICLKYLHRDEKKCEQIGGDPKVVNSCQSKVLSFAYGVYKGYSGSEVKCKIGKKITHWDGYSAINSKNTFSAIEQCKLEMLEINRSCLLSKGKLSLRPKPCRIKKCHTDGVCTASGQTSCAFQ